MIKQKIKLSNKENHPMYGKKQTIESKKKNSESQKGDKSPLFGLKGVNHPRYGTKASKELLDSIKKIAKPRKFYYLFQNEV